MQLSARTFSVLAVGITLSLGACDAQTSTPKAVSDSASTPEMVKEADLSSVIMDKSDGCLEGPNAQFGRYLGDWTMTSTTLSREDGKTWLDGGKARWNFSCVGNGVAVQDFWMPESGGSGTNLRMYNPKSESWDIAWTSTGTPGLSHINAKQDESGNIIMKYVSPIPTPLRRITFFSPDDTGWDWHLAMSTDGGENWTTVVKMRAEPRKS